MTNNLERRINEHKEQINKSFSSKYNVSRLVWYEECDTVMSGIEKDNPNWKDLYYLF